MVRVKHRYVLVNILYPEAKDSASFARRDAIDELPYSVQFHQPSSDKLDSKLFLRMIRDGVAELFGDYGSGMVSSSLQVKYLSPATSTAIIRVAREHFQLVWAALTFTTRLPKPVEQACVIHVVRVSGTIKKAEEEAIRRARRSIKRARWTSEVRDGRNAGLDEKLDFPGNDEADAFDGVANGIEDLDELEDEDYESE